MAQDSPRPSRECHYGIVRRDGTPKELRCSELVNKVADRMPDVLTGGQSIRGLHRRLLNTA